MHLLDEMNCSLHLYTNHNELATHQFFLYNNYGKRIETKIEMLYREIVKTNGAPFRLFS